ncbi:dipeptidyl peptidase 4-like isoform X3 [Syngnathoides biaculeatus]|uniref:dipeptidyl peptidase 4-like isoform X3 n=1 Tax=Syngnathoides biaculeatus TaxID=300417 RepID=UPI002ADD7EDC|nr:dipeptidyl peptidase 4-like isoform X3 [Syngnathoides biaculeatus]
MVSIAKVLLGVLGLVVVVILITVPTVLYLKEEQDDSTDRKFFTLADVFNSDLKPKTYSIRWISDDEYLHRREGSVYLHNVTAGQSSVFLSADTFTEKDASDYQLSADRRYVALLSNRRMVWRHSFTASYSLYDRTLNKFVEASNLPEEIQYLAWAPAGIKLAFVWKNNVYVKASPESLPQQVTWDGRENHILNGIPDWVYEEEMFSSNQGLWWSPGGKYLAYVQFNDTEVPTVEFSWFGNSQYPSTVSIPYPKAGSPNPVVKLFVVDTDNITVINKVLVPEPFSSQEHYLATVTWGTDQRLAIQWLQRLQTHLILQIYNLQDLTWVPVERLDVESSSGWIGRFSPSDPFFSEDKMSYYLLMSDSNGYKHIHHVVEGNATAITKGEWEVVAIQKVTADSVYYSSNQEGGKPGGRNIYRWTKGEVTCLTCNLSTDNCQYNSAYFSHNARFYLMSCNGPGIPFSSLMDNKEGKELKRLEDNSKFSQLISDIQMPTMRRGTLKIAGYKLWYQMFLPPGFDDSKKYPLLLDVYAGPCSQKVDFIYRVNWSTYLASTEKIIVASFDGRGSGYRGDKLMHEIYKRLGTFEVEDQITAASEFIKMGFIDKDRVAIWGWSYGGYVASMALGSGSGVFKCGMAVAPVSKWEYYDSIYTERYMTKPIDNQEAYTNSTVTARAKNFHSVQYLLVHGTADGLLHSFV